MSKLVIPKAATTARTAATPDAGEILYDKDTKELVYGDGSTAGGVVLKKKGSGPYVSVSSLTDGVLAVAREAFPVGLITNLGTVYPIEKGTVTRSSGTWRIDPTAYLVYDNSASFTGPWTIWFAGDY